VWLQSDLNTLFRISDMFVTEVLEWNESRHTVIQTSPHSNSLAWTATSVKVTPHLLTHTHTYTLKRDRQTDRQTDRQNDRQTD